MNFLFKVGILLVFLSVGLFYVFHRINNVKKDEHVNNENDTFGKYNFDSEQIKFLKSLDITPEDLSSFTSILSFAPLFAKEAISSAHLNVLSVLDDNQVSSLVKRVYYCNKIPFEVAFKILSSTFHNEIKEISERIEKDDGNKKSKNYDCNWEDMLSEVKELIKNNKFDGIKEYWNKFGGLISLAKDFLPGSIISKITRMASLIF